MTREGISAACAALGVLLLIAAGALPHAGIALLGGLGLLAVSHVLTPCRDQITKWWRHRVLRQ
jgi:hypothetical protein